MSSAVLAVTVFGWQAICEGTSHLSPAWKWVRGSVLRWSDRTVITKARCHPVGACYPPSLLPDPPAIGHQPHILADHEHLARLNTSKRVIWRALRTHDKDLFWHRWNCTEFELLLDRYLAAVDDRPDPRVLEGLRDMDTWRRRNQELVDLVLDHALAAGPHAPGRAPGRRARAPMRAPADVPQPAAAELAAEADASRPTRRRR